MIHNIQFLCEFPTYICCCMAFVALLYCKILLWQKRRSQLSRAIFITVRNIASRAQNGRLIKLDEQLVAIETGD